jgi:PilZ domain-containing protein
MSATTAPDSTQKTGAERRREQRYEVKLPGDLGVDGEIYSVTIADLSGSGALLVMDKPPDEGAVADLWIEGFGDLEVKIMFSGDGVCGVMFTRPAEHRDRLLKWLMQQLAEGKARP